MRKKDIIIIGFLFLIFASVIAYKISNRKIPTYEDYKNVFISESYKGAITRKYFIKEKHNSSAFDVKTMKAKKTIIPDLFLYETIRVGDSIVKNKGDSTITFFRDNKKNVLKFSEIYYGKIGNGTN